MLDVLCSDQQPLDAKSLFKLNFHKNSDGKHSVCMVPTGHKSPTNTPAPCMQGSTTAQ